MTPDTLENAAIRSDAEQRVAELRAVREALLPDRDDPQVMSELTLIDSELRSAEAEVSGLVGERS